MSKLIVEVCKIEDVSLHPNADKLEIAKIKGWLVIVQKGQYTAGQKCVYFPPNAILPPSLANSPEDEIPGRMNCMKYLHALPKDEKGERPKGGRVAAVRLRGQVSYGLIMPIDPQFGDNPDWEVGTDVAQHFGIEKYEPPIESTEGDVESPSVKFQRYTSIENIGNFPNVFKEGEEVIFTEKIHGSNCRVGAILEPGDSGEAQWQLTAGSHSLQRKQYVNVEHRFKLEKLSEEGVSSSFEVGSQFVLNSKIWEIKQQVLNEKGEFDRVHCFLKTESGEPVKKISIFWEPLEIKGVKLLVDHLANEFSWKEPKFSVILFGEIFGAGVQDMQYGILNRRAFRVFDISINGEYLDADVQNELLTKFGVKSGPILFRGKFSQEELQKYTCGPTTLCTPDKAGPFKGREGIVIRPVKESAFCSVLCDRKILKSISADYMARKNGTEFH